MVSDMSGDSRLAQDATQDVAALGAALDPSIGSVIDAPTSVDTAQGQHGTPGADGFGVGFSIVRRGYDLAEVDTHLRRLETEIQILHTDRAAAVAQSNALNRELDAARARAERLRMHIQHSSTQPQNVQGVSERMRTMLRLAEDEVADRLAKGDALVDERLRAADLEARRITEAARVDAAAVRAAVQHERDEHAAAHERGLAQLAEDRRVAEERLAVAHAAVEADRERILAELTAERERIREETATERRRIVAELDAERTAFEAERRQERTTLASARQVHDAELAAERAAAVTERDRLLAELAAQRQQSEADIAAATEEAAQARAHAWADSEHRRATVEDDFEIAMDQRRAEAIAALGTQLTDARAEAVETRRQAAADAEATRAAAAAQAEQMVAEAQRKVDALTTLRNQVARQLGGIRDEIHDVVGICEELPAERPDGLAIPAPAHAPVSEVGPPVEETPARHPSPRRRKRQRTAHH